MTAQERFVFGDPAIQLCLERRLSEVQRDCQETALPSTEGQSYLYEARVRERNALWAAIDMIKALANPE